MFHNTDEYLNDKRNRIIGACFRCEKLCIEKTFVVIKMDFKSRLHQQKLLKN